MKKILFTMFICVISFIALPKVNAASLNISAASSVEEGSSVRVTVRASGVTGKISVSSSNSGVLSGGGTDWFENSSKTYTFKANKTGKATITASASDASDSDGGSFSGSRSVTINVVAKDTRSTNNNLKSLSVEGQTLSPEFNSDITEYSLEVPNDVNKIKINAEASDSKSTVSGTGTKEVKVGENNFDIVVKSERGSTKTYKIKVTVDTKPIIVEIDGDKYNLIKKKEQLPELLAEHEDMTLTIDEQEVPAYRIDKLNYVLVGLKSDDGTINLYRFISYKDKEKPSQYILFNQVVSPGVYIVYTKFPEKLVPDGYKKYTEKINDTKVTVYKKSKDSNYSLFYGINMASGKKNIYKYDSKEETVQIYDDSELKGLKHDMMIAKIILLSLCAFSGLLIIIIVILIGTRRQKIKKILHKYKEKMKEKQELPQ